MTPATDSERDACVCLPWHPDTDGPDETCPQHGRPYAYWVEAEARMADLAAEQAATIERVRGLHKPDRGMPNACCECGTRFPCETITALGSHRTEGHRG